MIRRSLEVGHAAEPALGLTHRPQDLQRYYCFRTSYKTDEKKGIPASTLEFAGPPSFNVTGLEGEEGFAQSVPSCKFWFAGTGEGRSRRLFPFDAVVVSPARPPSQRRQRRSPQEGRSAAVSVLSVAEDSDRKEGGSVPGLG